MKSYIYILNCLIICTSAYSQDLEILYKGKELEINYEGEFNIRYLNLKEFNQLDWQPGFVYYPDGNSRVYEGMKYNLLDGRVAVNAKGTILTLLPGVVSGVSMKSGNVIDHLFVKVDLQKPVFMEVLAAGKIDLLLYRWRLEEKEDIINAVHLRFEKEIEVINYDEKMYGWTKNGVMELKPSKKFILNIMADKTNEIELYLKENKVKMKVPEDMIRLIKYYNGL